MKSDIINAVHLYLTGVRGFVPADTPGEGHNAVRLIRENGGRLLAIEFVDGDGTSIDGISGLLSARRDELKSLKGRSGVQLIEVFLFDGPGDYDRLKAISDRQFRSITGSVSVSCLSVNIAEAKTASHTSKGWSVRWVKQLMDAVLAQYHGGYLAPPADDCFGPEGGFMASLAQKGAPLTYILTGINIAVWLLVYLYVHLSGKDYGVLIVLLGAKDNAKIMQGELWRFITPVFLHASLMHLVINSYSLYSVGMFVERLYGKKRFAAIYFFAGLTGSIASFIFSPRPGVGASGAIFGLLGALVYFGVEYPDIYRKYFGYNIITTIVINVIYGFSNAGIDNFAHLGGLVGGFLAAAAVGAGRKPARLPDRRVIAAAALALAAGGILCGFSLPQNKAIVNIRRAESSNAEKQWAQAEREAEAALSYELRNSYLKSAALEAVIQSEFSQNKYDEAIEHSRLLTAFDPARGHYILGILYYNTRQFDLAGSELKEAVKHGADYENIREIIESINKINAGKQPDSGA